jgi:hypothetical protein
MADRPAFDEITSEMMESGHAALARWLLRWDYLADGMPHESEVDALLASVYESMEGTKQLALKKSRNLS